MTRAATRLIRTSGRPDPRKEPNRSGLRGRLGRVGGIALLLFVVSQVLWWAEPFAAFGPLTLLTPDLVWRVETDRPMVGLSIDDGPHPVYTRQVIGLLAASGARATFFLIGERALAHPDVVQEIKAAGHEVGNHCFRDGSVLGQADRDFVADLDRTEKAIGLTRSPRLFRPPGGLAWPWQVRRARERGYRCVLGSAYPHDPAHPPVRYIQWLIEKNLVPGAIVILHDGISDPTRGIQALPHVLAAGRRRGLTFVSVGELLREGGDAAGRAAEAGRE